MNPTKHISVDLETMGTDPDAAIIAIGAVEFDPLAPIRSLAPVRGSSFYTRVSLAGNLVHGRTVTADTIIWWMQQSDTARLEFANNAKDPSLFEAMRDLWRWFDKLGAFMATPRPDFRIWAKGPSFDCVLLTTAFDKMVLKRPWKHSEERCVRTVCDLAGVEPNDFASGTKHNALDDAMSQAAAVQQAIQNLRAQTKIG